MKVLVVDSKFNEHPSYRLFTDRLVSNLLKTQVELYTLVRRKSKSATYPDYVVTIQEAEIRFIGGYYLTTSHKRAVRMAVAGFKSIYLDPTALYLGNSYVIVNSIIHIHRSGGIDKLFEDHLL